VKLCLDAQSKKRRSKPARRLRWPLFMIVLRYAYFRGLDSADLHLHCSRADDASVAPDEGRSADSSDSRSTASTTFSGLSQLFHHLPGRAPAGGLHHASHRPLRLCASRRSPYSSPRLGYSLIAVHRIRRPDRGGTRRHSSVDPDESIALDWLWNRGRPHAG